jgi:hypothetical protein
VEARQQKRTVGRLIEGGPDPCDGLLQALASGGIGKDGVQQSS